MGALFDVHTQLGRGFLEVVYADAIQYELEQRKIPFTREMQYKDTILPHYFYANFVIYDEIILEIKSIKHTHDAHVVHCLNYLKITGKKLAILVNFEAEKLYYKRIVL